jgi:hypothetical protein
MPAAWRRVRRGIFLPMSILIPLKGKTRGVADMLRHGAGLITPGPELALLAPLHGNAEGPFHMRQEDA